MAIPATPAQPEGRAARLTPMPAARMRTTLPRRWAAMAAREGPETWWEQMAATAEQAARRPRPLRIQTRPCRGLFRIRKPMVEQGGRVVKAVAARVCQATAARGRTHIPAA